MGSGASLKLPEVGPDENELENYGDDHQVAWAAWKKRDWEEVYKYVPTQSSAGCFRQLGAGNYQNCIAFCVGAIGHEEDSPEDVDNAVALLCKSVAIAKWSPLHAMSLAKSHPKRTEVMKKFLSEIMPETQSMTAAEKVDLLLPEIIDNPQSEAKPILLLATQCLMEGSEDKAFSLLDAYLKLQMPQDPYDSGEMLLKWYALRWRKSGRKPNYVGKVAVLTFKNANVKILEEEDGEAMDLGLSGWNEDFETSTVPRVMNAWRFFSDAMSFLTDGAIGFEPIVVDACWDVVIKAHHPVWDRLPWMQRCISQPNTYAAEFRAALEKWENDYMAANGGETDVIAFHLLWPAAKHPKGLDYVWVTVGGMVTNTIQHSAFKGRPCIIDEGLETEKATFGLGNVWHFHECHHIYESHFKDFQFASLCSKQGHPSFNKDLWFDEFKEASDWFPPGWKPCTEVDWYIQSITQNLNTLKEPSFADRWKNWWGGKEYTEAGGYYPFGKEHQTFWQAYNKQKWERVCELLDSQLRPMCCKKIGKGNYRNVVSFGIRSLMRCHKALDGPVVDCLAKGMAVLDLPPEKAVDLIQWGSEEQKYKLLEIYVKKEREAHPGPIQQKRGAPITMLDGHFHMRDAYEDEEWPEVLEHIETQVSEAFLEQFGEQLFKSSLRMALAAVGNEKTSPEDVDDAAALISKSMQWTGWTARCFVKLLQKHPKRYEVLLAIQPPDDPEGHHYPFGEEHQIFWKAYAGQKWERVCELLDSQLRPMCCTRIGPGNYRNVISFGIRSLIVCHKALDGPVVDCLAKGMEVLKLPKEREEAAKLIQWVSEGKEEELLSLFLAE